MNDATALSPIKPYVLRELTEDSVQKELGIQKLGELTNDQLDAAENEKADRLIATLLDAKTLVDRETTKTLLEQAGEMSSRQAVERSKMLQVRVSQLAARGGDTETIANDLVSLTNTCSELDPSDIDFSRKSGFRLLKFFAGDKVTEYFMKYQTAQTMINDILESLEHGRQLLQRNNIVLAEDKKNIRNESLRLESVIRILKRVDDKIDTSLNAGEVPADSVEFIQNEIQFGIRQKLIALGKKLLAAQQGVVSMDLLIKNNIELLNGVKTAQELTVFALEIAIIVAKAVSDQELILDKIKALNNVTDNMMNGTARRIGSAGVRIQQEAIDSGISVGRMIENSAILRKAVEELKTFRQRNLGTMQETANRLLAAIEDNKDLIEDSEKGAATVGTMLSDFGIA